MVTTIQVPLTDQHCAQGAAYAKKHLTTPSKVAVLCCEGACLRGEIARRAANLVTAELAPERSVRVCHGGLLETAGGMKELVQHAQKVLQLDGCAMACGTRLLQGAMPDIKPVVVFADQLYDFDRNKFSLVDMSDTEIQQHARTVAERIVAMPLK